MIIKLQRLGVTIVSGTRSVIIKLDNESDTKVREIISVVVK